MDHLKVNFFFFCFEIIWFFLLKQLVCIVSKSKYHLWGYNFIVCLDIQGTHETANNSTNNNAVFFCVLIRTLNTITAIYPRSQCLGQERKNILRDYLFGEKIIQNCLKIDVTHLYDKNFLLRQENQKKIACSRSWLNNISRSKDEFFTGRVPFGRHYACLRNKSLS